jgi:3'(2'), 5'-bisphosphate nucleotidase
MPHRIDPALLARNMETMAVAAGRLIMRVFSTGCATLEKDDGSPVTIADQLAEALIVASLREHYPNIPIIAEEAAAAGHYPETPDNSFFIVDPLDGTKEFISRTGDFTVNIALVIGGFPIAGCVLAPASGALYVGTSNGAYRAAIDLTIEEAPSTWQRVAIAARPPAEPPVAVASRLHTSPLTDKYLAEKGITHCTQVGSSLKFCLLAAGEADIYPRFTRTMEWDTAAGDAVLRAAGGATLCLDGTPLAYGKRHGNPDAPFANPHFIARGRS